MRPSRPACRSEHDIPLPSVSHISKISKNGIIPLPAGPPICFDEAVMEKATPAAWMTKTEAAGPPAMREVVPLGLLSCRRAEKAIMHLRIVPFGSPAVLFLPALAGLYTFCCLQQRRTVRKRRALPCRRLVVSASGKQTKTQELASGSCNLSPERAASSPQISQFASVLHSPGINSHLPPRRSSREG